MTEPTRTEDAWEAARERARTEVAAAYAPRRQVCPSCGREEVTSLRSCPHCGASYVQWRPRRRLSRRGWALVAIGVAALAAGLAVLIPVLHRTTVREETRAAAAQRRLEAAERRRLEREGRPRFARSAATTRVAVIGDIERSITRDARARIRAGQLDGPVRGTSCSPYPPGSPARSRLELDPDARRLRYLCVAYKAKIPLSELEGRQRTGVFGFLFYAVLTNPGGRYAWCKVTPLGSEGARLLATVPVPPACRP